MNLIELDKHVTLWINSLGTPGWDGFWLFLSNSKVWFPAYAVVMFVMVRRLGWKKGLLVVASLILTVVLTDQLSDLIKGSLHRLRPAFDVWMVENGLRVPVKHWHWYGFFSGHASNTFGFVAASYLGLKNDTQHSYKAYGWGVCIWAVLVCLSRIMLGAHYLGDILVGILFGLAVGTAVALLTRVVIGKFAKV